LLQKFIETEDKTQRYNPRMAAEAEKQERYRQKMRENGGKGGRPRAENQPVTSGNQKVISEEPEANPNETSSVFCLQSSIPKEQVQVPSPSPPGERADLALVGQGPKKGPDPRNASFKQALADHYRNTVQMDMTWDGSEGKQLSQFLSANPSITLSAFEVILDHCAKSEVSHSDRPRAWLSGATKFLAAPLDRYGKPKTFGGTHGKPSRIEQIADSNTGTLELLATMDTPAYLSGGGAQARADYRPLLQSSHDPALAGNAR
jgi:hypothetical protein